MESVLAQAIRLGDFLVDSVCAHGFRDGVMKGGVKEGDAPDLGQLGSAVSNYFQC